MGNVICLFDESGIMGEPWRQAGHNIIQVDLKAGDGIYEWMPTLAQANDVAFVCAFPPCTDLSVSGAAHFKGKGLGRLASAIHLFHMAARWCEFFQAPYMIENPVSTISRYWRPPDHTFHPYHFTGYEADDNYTKKTCLWTGHGFRMPDAKMRLFEPDQRMHALGPSPERAAIRSRTPAGFARAVYEFNVGNPVRVGYP